MFINLICKNGPMKKLISKILTKKINEALGKNTTIRLNNLEIVKDKEEDKLNIHVDTDITITEDELAELLDNL